MHGEIKDMNETGKTLIKSKVSGDLSLVRSAALILWGLLSPHG